MFIRNLIVFTGSALLMTLGVLAADKPHHGQSGHTAADHGHAMPSEGGQAAFSALIEIVSLLESDPKTDWSTVRVNLLREHLRDMSYLILDTEATTRIIAASAVEFVATGEGAALAALHRMVPVHADMIADSRGWSIDTSVNDAGAVVVVSGLGAADIVRLEALGFYGFMALDAHHQRHHYQLVTGRGH